MNEIGALFRRLSAGVYVVGASHGDRRGAFTAAWVMQASFDPPLLVLSISPDHATYPLLHASGAFTVSVLKRGQLEVAQLFGTRSGREQDKLEGVRWHAGRSGAPVLEGTLAYFDCELVQRVPAGDHELVIGRVVAGRILDPDAVPMSYSDTGDMDGSSALYPPRF